MTDVNKGYQTRDGRAVRILATEIKSVRPIAGIVTNMDGGEQLCSWDADERYFTSKGDSPLDLVSVSTKHEMWAVIYADGDYHTAVADRFLFSTEAFAQGAADVENREHPSLTHGKAHVVLVTWGGEDLSSIAPVSVKNEAWMAITNYGLPDHKPFQAMGSWLYDTLGAAKVQGVRIGGIVAHVTWEG